MVVALPNEFIEILKYNILKVFAEKEMSFILTFLQMSNFVNYKVW